MKLSNNLFYQLSNYQIICHNCFTLKNAVLVSVPSYCDVKRWWTWFKSSALYLHLSMGSFLLSLSSPVTFVLKLLLSQLMYLSSALLSSCWLQLVNAFVDFFNSFMHKKKFPHKQLSSHFIDLIYTYFWNFQRFSGSMSTSYSHFWGFVSAITVSLLDPLCSNQFIFPWLVEVAHAVPGAALCSI